MLRTAMKGHAKLTAVFDRAEEGGFSCHVKEVKGVHSQGETIKEARENLMDALHMILASNLEKTLSGKDLSKRHIEAELIDE
jgi:predicted RNase H-like HicB family nuclease